MRKEGHNVVVYERGHALGGNWVYMPEVESHDLLGPDPKRRVVHSSLYKSLRTNLPREIMGYLDYPFTVRLGGDGFPGYREVAAYLADFARDFDLDKWIHFRTNVVHMGKVGDGRWLVHARRVSDDGEQAADESQLFDAVVVCSGHLTEPRITDVPGKWPPSCFPGPPFLFLFCLVFSFLSSSRSRGKSGGRAAEDLSLDSRWAVEEARVRRWESRSWAAMAFTGNGSRGEQKLGDGVPSARAGRRRQG